APIDTGGSLVALSAILPAHAMGQRAADSAVGMAGFPGDAHAAHAVTVVIGLVNGTGDGDAAGASDGRHPAPASGGRGRPWSAAMAAATLAGGRHAGCSGVGGICPVPLSGSDAVVRRQPATGGVAK